MMSLKAHKELELRIHDAFYANVCCLTLFNPPSKEFQELFKKDMFVKNNKAGFHHAVYYLLETLDSERLKTNITSWPLLNTSLENQFRKEVMKYVNELNTLYEEADIPQIVTSHLISPGGFKFINFMFKLSQLVLRQQLKSSSNCAGLLLPMKPHTEESVTEETIGDLNVVTNNIYAVTDQITDDFERWFDTMQTEAAYVTEEQVKGQRNFKQNQVKLEDLKKQVANDFPNSYTTTVEEVKINLEHKLEKLKQLKGKFNKLHKLSTHLSSSNAKLEHNTPLLVPSWINVNVEEDSLNLTSLIEVCTRVVDRNTLELNAVSDRELSKQIGRFTLLNEQLTLFNEEMDGIYSRMAELSDQVGTVGSLINSTPLAEPLPPTPMSTP